MYASAKKLDNLIAIVDSNKVQLDGTIKEILDTGDLKAKYESFGFRAGARCLTAERKERFTLSDSFFLFIVDFFSHESEGNRLHPGSLALVP